MHIKPDLTYSVKVLSRYAHNLSSIHCILIKRVLRYVAETLNVGLRFSKKSQNVNNSHSNDSHSDDLVSYNDSHSDTLRNHSGSKPNRSVWCECDSDSGLVFPDLGTTLEPNRSVWVFSVWNRRNFVYIESFYI